VYIIASYLY